MVNNDCPFVKQVSLVGTKLIKQNCANFCHKENKVFFSGGNAYRFSVIGICYRERRALQRRSQNQGIMQTQNLKPNLSYLTFIPLEEGENPVPPFSNAFKDKCIYFMVNVYNRSTPLRDGVPDSHQ